MCEPYRDHLRWKPQRRERAPRPYGNNLISRLSHYSNSLWANHHCMPPWMIGLLSFMSWEFAVKEKQMMNVHTDSQQFGYGGHDHRSFLRDVAMG